MCFYIIFISLPDAQKILQEYCQKLIYYVKKTIQNAMEMYLWPIKHIQLPTKQTQNNIDDLVSWWYIRQFFLQIYI